MDTCQDKECSKCSHYIDYMLVTDGKWRGIGFCDCLFDEINATDGEACNDFVNMMK